MSLMQAKIEVALKDISNGQHWSDDYMLQVRNILQYLVDSAGQQEQERAEPIRKELAHLIDLIEPGLDSGKINIPGLATLNASNMDNSITPETQPGLFCKECGTLLERASTVIPVGITPEGCAVYKAVYTCKKKGLNPFSKHTDRYI